MGTCPCCHGQCNKWAVSAHIWKHFCGFVLNVVQGARGNMLTGLRSGEGHVTEAEVSTEGQRKTVLSALLSFKCAVKAVANFS